jgi:hypothetical protein
LLAFVVIARPQDSMIASRHLHLIEGTRPRACSQWR